MLTATASADALRPIIMAANITLTEEPTRPSKPSRHAIYEYGNICRMKLKECVSRNAIERTCIIEMIISLQAKTREVHGTVKKYDGELFARRT
jgi:hypothetical protein